MLSFNTAFVAAAAAAGVLAVPAAEPAELVTRANTPNAQGMNNGFFYQFWDDGSSGTTTYTNGPAGEYSVTWSNVGDFTSGKGWKQATDRVINFSGTVQSSGNFYLAVYTWSEQGENYILEDYGTYDPCSSGTSKGTLTSDGSVYDVCLVDRGNNYYQNWSVRRNKRSSGTVTTANHYNYYASHGGYNPLSAADYQIVSTEGYGSSGSATITVSEGSSSSSPPPSSTSSGSGPTSSSTSGSGGSCSALYGQCGGEGWNGPTCCSSGTCKYSNAWYSQCL